MIPTVAGPDTICVCGHWYEEHYLPSDGDPAGCEGCFAARFGDAAEHGFEFDPDENTPIAIANRGGDPEAWPQWVKDAAKDEDGEIPDRTIRQNGPQVIGEHCPWCGALVIDADHSRSHD